MDAPIPGARARTPDGAFYLMVKLPVPDAEADSPVVPWVLHFRDDEVAGENVRVAYLWVAPEGMQIQGAKLGGIFNMGGAAVANYVSILERRR